MTPATRPSSMEPLLPSDPKQELRDLAIDVLRRSAALGAQLRDPTRSSVAELLRPMNSYYSNLIEGHSTHPIEIDRAMRADYGGDAKKRQLQQEGLAHIEVQRLMEARLRDEPALAICSPSFLCWIHREFYLRMPPELRPAVGAGQERRRRQGMPTSDPPGPCGPRRAGQPSGSEPGHKRRGDGRAMQATPPP